MPGKRAQSDEIDFFGVLSSDYVRDRLCGDAEVERDLKLAFTSKNVDRGGYSTGSTFFIGATDDPACLLEQMALKIFEFHAKRLGKDIDDDSRGGAEWWSQVIDARDDIGWHWDRDYGSEEEGILLYPNVATVTYVKTEGGATVVTNMRGQKGDVVSVGFPIGNGMQNRCCISKPKMGKHLFFDGDCLHGAPTDLNEEESDSEESEGDGDDEDDEDGVVKRITFLVNCWFDRRPIEASRIPQEIARSMSSPRKWEDEVFRTATMDAVIRQEVRQNVDTDDTLRSWSFSDCARKYRLSLPVKTMRLKADIDSLQVGETLEFFFSGNEGKGYVALHDLGEQSEDEDEDEDEGEGEEEDEGEEEGENERKGEDGPSLKKARAG